MTRQNMQELLDRARSPAAVYNPIPNPWKWNYGEDRWPSTRGEMK